VRPLAILTLVTLACFSQAHADERVLSYDSEITVQPDGSLNVRETIRVRSEGNQIRRGIYRDFPTTYAGRDGRQLVVGFDFQSAQRDGSPEEWRTESRDNGVRIYLGRASVMLPRGEHTYEIDYRTNRQLGFFADHDELYWNVTGNGWDFPIDLASARVLLPEAVPTSLVHLEAYTGPQGARGSAYSARLIDGTPTFETTQSLGGHEGLTIVVTWPKGFITPAVENPAGTAFSSSGSGAGQHGLGVRGNLVIRDQRPAVFGLGGLAILLFYYIWIWNKVGRDPPGRIVIPEYEPPPDISPGSMRYLMEMRYDDRCFAADVLNLAVKGHLIIKEDEKGLLGLKKQFTLIKQTRPDAKPLSAEETSLLTKIFSLGTELELTQENHAWVGGTKAFHRRLLKGRFMPNFFRINGGWHALGIVWSIVIVLALFASANLYVLPQWYFTTRLGWLTIAAVLVGLVSNGVFGILLKAPTVVGRATMDHVRGFKMYLEVAEGEDLKRVTTPPPPLTPELYHAYLPAALGLGVEQRWGERFARVFAEQPDDRSTPVWYSGSSWDSRHLGSFSSSLGSQLDGAISSSSTAPGSSSGSSGGGSSGGGGGGGGGGGW
jgi:uncharacterized membrane protein YgcG